MVVESVGGELLALGSTLPQGYRQASSSEGVAPWTDRVVTVMLERSWLTGILIGTTAERIMQDTPCSVLAAKLEGLRHDVS